MNSYELSRNWFNYCFDNPEKVKPAHTAVYFFSIEHCNRLGWKEKFGFPSQMVMEAVGIKNWRTYSKVLNDLVDFGFIKMIEISKNQYSSNIIAIVKNTKAPTKALDKALQKHSTKQGQSTVSINKQYNNITNNNKDDDIINIYKKFVDEIKFGGFATRIESLYMNLKIKEGSLTPLLKEYKHHIISENRLHKNTNEFFINFKNWLNTQERIKKLDKYK
jgi:hypothetical protein